MGFGMYNNAFPWPQSHLELHDKARFTFVSHRYHPAPPTRVV